MTAINVISCFDGLGGSREALKRAGIPVANYFAYEIDKYAVKIAGKNHPDIQHLGDIQSWEFFDGIPVPDLIIGGFPCQGFSIAGNRLDFDDPRSRLFFSFANMISHYKKLNPKLKFLGENVARMSAAAQSTISGILGVNPVRLNSSLVSAQNRDRLYWANWKITEPKDRGIILADILEDGGTGVIRSHGKLVERNDKALCCLDANYHKGADNHGQRTMVRIGTADVNGHDILKRVYSPFGKSPTLNTNGGGNREPKVEVAGDQWRKLTPLECERLQTLPDNYTEGVSNTQRYKMIGNGFTIDMIVHILQEMQNEQ